MSGKTKFAVFVSISVLAALALLEIAARIGGYGPPARSQGYQESKFRPDKELLWELTPGWSGQEGLGKIGINSFGFRDDEIPVPKPLGERRIFCLGDSVTFGYMVDQNDPWPRALQRIYGNSGKNVRIINAGIPGYSTFQERDQLRLKGWALDPDIVILGYCLNDVIERYTSIAEYGGKDVFLGVDTSSQLPCFKRLLKKIAIFRFITLKLQDRVKREELFSVRRLNEDPLPPELLQAWEKNKEEIIGINKDVQAHGKRFLLIIFPYYFQIMLGEKAEVHQRRLLDLCNANVIKCVDLFPTFYSHRNEPLFFDGNHLSPAGHSRASEAIYGAL